MNLLNNMKSFSFFVKVIFTTSVYYYCIYFNAVSHFLKSIYQIKNHEKVFAILLIISTDLNSCQKNSPEQTKDTYMSQYTNLVDINPSDYQT